MRALALLVLLACGGKKEAPSPGSAAKGSDVVAVDASAPPPQVIELLAAVPSTLRVSSKVANPKIRPQELVDRDLNTAWNSVTGDLVGAWIEFVLPPSVTIHDLRLTVGHTGKGPKGEDYFTMNHRIKKVSILVDNEVIQTFPLDPERRDLQTLKFSAPGGNIRVRVDEVVPGTKKTWREVCVSEVEVWGTVAPGWKPPAKPLVPTVDVAPRPAVTSLDKLCAYLPAALKQRARDQKQHDKNCAFEHSEEARAACRGEPPGDPDCNVNIATTIEGIAPPWKGVAVLCDTDDASWDGQTCNVAAAMTGQLIHGPRFPGSDPHDYPRRGYIVDASVQDVIPGDAPELVVTVAFHAATPLNPDARDDRELLVVCRATPAACSTEIATKDTGWSTTVKFDQGAAVLTADDGKPPANAIGRQPIVFKK